MSLNTQQTVKDLDKIITKLGDIYFHLDAIPDDIWGKSLKVRFEDLQHAVSLIEDKYDI